ncbi:MAG: 1-acyl-sn-glycerol-3-phosphate acyltransferase [Acholeplasmataceae bacterium]|nr:1-acyl-sn-glycerol-3-phosphate acyltransferase [Acholeplasmataceae bacterium]
MKRPNLLVYLSLGFLLKIFAFFKGQRITKKINIKGPAIVLSNHTSFYDFIYTTNALYPHRVSYLAASKMFYEPLLGFFLRLARAIPKSLFQPDPVAVLHVFKMLKKGAIISVFPEGQISPIGKSLKPAFSIAKLIKKGKVDVYTTIHKNAYFVNPPWSKKSFKGRIETEMELILKKEDLVNMSEQEIYNLVVNHIYFNAAQFNEEKKNKYQVNAISNLENVIYQCPSCLHEGLSAEHTKLHCPKCQTDFHYDVYGKIGGYRIDELFLAQEKRLQQKIKDDDFFELSRPVKLESFRDYRLKEVGQGMLSLNKDRYLYQGTIDGKKQELVFDVKNVQTLPSDIGRNIQIYEGYQIYQFVFEDKKCPTMFVHAGEFMYQINSDIKQIIAL